MTEEVAKHTVKKGAEVSSGVLVSKVKVTIAKLRSPLRARPIVVVAAGTSSLPEAEKVPLWWKRHRVAIELETSGEAPNVLGFLNQAVEVPNSSCNTPYFVVLSKFMEQSISLRI